MRGYMTRLSRVELTGVDDSSGEQTVDYFGLAGETHTKVHRPQAFGMSSHPPKGSVGLVLDMQGERSSAMVLGAETPGKRPTGMPEGASVLYDSEGNVIYARTGSGIEISAKKGKIFIKPPADKMVFLGGDGEEGSYDFVVTASGPCINVKGRYA